MVKKKTVYVSQCEREHIISGLRSGLDDITSKREYLRLSYELFVILHKLGLLEKELKIMERIDSINYETLRKRLVEVKNNANRLLNTKHIAVDEMRYVVKNLNSINEKMKKMAKKLIVGNSNDGSNRAGIKHTKLERQESSTTSSATLKRYVAPEKELKISLMSRFNERNNHNESARGRSKTPNQVFVPSRSSSDNRLKETTETGKRSRSQEDIALDSGVNKISRKSEQNCSTTEDLSEEKSSSENHLEPELSCLSLTSTISMKYCKSSDDPDYRKTKENLRELSINRVKKRWSISSFTANSRKKFNRNILALYSSKRGITNNNIENLHILNKTDSVDSDTKPRFVRLTGLVSSERQHLKDVRRKIFSDSSTGISKNRTIADGCCFNSNSLIEIFETSDTSLKIQEAAKDGLYDRYVTFLEFETASEDTNKPFRKPSTPDKGLTKKDGDADRLGNDGRYRKDFSDSSSSDKKHREKSKITNKGGNEELERESNPDPIPQKKRVKRISVNSTSQGTQSENSKVTRTTSYDNFVLHPKFDWDVPLSGKSFNRKTSYDSVRFGNSQRLITSSLSMNSSVKSQKKLPTEDKSVQTTEVIFTDSMHQVMYLNVVYTKTHVKYILPPSMKMPVLPQTPKVIERRAIDNGYAVTTYKTDPDGVIHFTLAFSEDKKKGSSLPPDVNKRLCQLKDLWVSSASKFLSHMTDKLGKTVYVTGGVSNEDQESSVSYSTDASSTSSGTTTKGTSSTGNS